MSLFYRQLLSNAIFHIRNTYLQRGTGEKYCHVQAGNANPSHNKSRLESAVEANCGALGTIEKQLSPKKPNDS